MRHNILVKIPQGAMIAYTLYAQGIKIENPKANDSGEFIQLKFLGGTVVALFYTFAKFRRAYLVTEWQDEKDGDAIFLPGVDAPLCLIMKAKGRQIDELKRALFWLTKTYNDTVFRMPEAFWYRLSALIQSYGRKKLAVTRLFDTFRKSTNNF